MSIDVYFKASSMKNLDAKMAFIRGRGAKILAENISTAVVEGNLYDRVHGRDRYGVSLKPLKSPRKGQYRGLTGPPLAPSGVNSRVVQNFRSQARRFGGQWRIVAGWINVLSKKGVPFLPFHAIGSGRLPRRDIFGISPKTMAAIRKLIGGFKLSVREIHA